MSLEPLALANLIGTAAFALSGFLTGVRKRLDLLGVSIFAFVTALGGGVARDVLLGVRPVALMGHEAFLTVSAIIIVALALRLQRRTLIEQTPLFVVADALGLVTFAFSGALAGIHAGLGLFGVVSLAFITAVGGGMVRDVLAGEVPMILEREVYGTVAIGVGLGIWVVHHTLGPSWLYMLIVALGMLVRLVAHTQRWNLPRFGA